MKFHIFLWTCKERKELTYYRFWRMICRLLCRLCTVPFRGGWKTRNSNNLCLIGRVSLFPVDLYLVYIRGVNGEDLSTFIKSVTFGLHHSFAQHQRGISFVHPPPFSDHPIPVWSAWTRMGRVRGWGQGRIQERCRASHHLHPLSQTASLQRWTKQTWCGKYVGILMTTSRWLTSFMTSSSSMSQQSTCINYILSLSSLPVSSLTVRWWLPCPSHHFPQNPSTGFRSMREKRWRLSCERRTISMRRLFVLIAFPKDGDV